MHPTECLCPVTQGPELCLRSQWSGRSQGVGIKPPGFVVALISRPFSYTGRHREPCPIDVHRLRVTQEIAEEDKQPL